MAGRTRGWLAALGLAAVTGMFSVIQAGLLIFIPLSLMLVALPPRRLVLVVLGMAGAALLLSGGPGDSLADFGRGWALILGAWFLVATVLIEGDRFLTRGLVALAGSVATVAGLFALRPSALAAVDALVRRRLETGVEQLIAAGLGTDNEIVAEAVRTGAEFQALLYPALVAIASLSALAVAWWAYRRLTAQDLDALRPLREFRFGDGMVWLLIAGLLLVLLPVGELAVRAGSNLLAFTAALYALRGVAVLLVLGGVPGPLGMVVTVIVAIVLYPMVVAATFLVGLTDTWLDIRTRRAAVEPPGN